MKTKELYHIDGTFYQPYQDEEWREVSGYIDMGMGKIHLQNGVIVRFTNSGTEAFRYECYHDAPVIVTAVKAYQPIPSWKEHNILKRWARENGIAVGKVRGSGNQEKIHVKKQTTDYGEVKINEIVTDGSIDVLEHNNEGMKLVVVENYNYLITFDRKFNIAGYQYHDIKLVKIPEPNSLYLDQALNLIYKHIDTTTALRIPVWERIGKPKV